MSWVDDACEESEQLAGRRNAIESGSGQLYDNLWDEIKSRLEEIRQKGRKLYTNGAPYDRIVSPTPPSHRAGYAVDTTKDCHIKLDAGRITVSGANVNLVFIVDVCPDGLVCLKLNGREVNIPDAGKMILRTLAFPELPKQTAQTA